MSNNKLSPKSVKNLAKFKQVVGYSEPYPCICDAEFVAYVQKNSDKSVSEALQELLGGKVKLLSTMCINIAVLGMYRGEPNIYHFESTEQPCLHTRDEPEYDTDKCVKAFVRNYLGHRLIICSTNREDYDFYSSIPGRILVIPDGGDGGDSGDSDGGDSSLGAIKISPLTNFSLRQPQPQFRIMDDYIRIFRLKAPLLVICEPEFVRHVQQSSFLTSSLESLLGGRISLVSTTCIHNEMNVLNIDTSEFKDTTVQNCGHNELLSGAACAKLFAKMYPGSAQVVCTMEEQEHYAKVPNKIVVIPNGRGGIVIYSQAVDACFRYARNNTSVRHMLSILRARLLDHLVRHSTSSSSSDMIYLYRQPVSFMVCSEDGEKFGPFTSVVETADKIMEVSGANVTKEGFDCELSVDEMEDNPIVDIFVKNTITDEMTRNSKWKLSSLEGDTENPGSEATVSGKVEVDRKSKTARRFQDAEMNVDDSAEPATLEEEIDNAENKKKKKASKKKIKKKKLESKSAENEASNNVGAEPKKKKRSIEDAGEDDFTAKRKKKKSFE